MPLKNKEANNEKKNEAIDKELEELVGIIKNEKVDDLKEYMRKNKELEYFNIGKEEKEN